MTTFAIILGSMIAGLIIGWWLHCWWALVVESLRAFEDGAVVHGRAQGGN